MHHQWIYRNMLKGECPEAGYSDEEISVKRRKDDQDGLVCLSLTSLCHSNGHIETMPAREINPFTALTRIRSQFLRTQ